MKLKKLLLIIFPLAVLVAYGSFMSYGPASAINVFVNNLQITLDAPPVNSNKRLLIPVSFVTQFLGADVFWDESSRVVTANTPSVNVTIPIDSSVGYKNDIVLPLDAPARIIDGRVFIPLRFIAESLGAEVHWDSKGRSIFINKEEIHNEFSFKGISLDSSLTEVSAILGTPNRIDISEYDFEWYFFHQDYRDYIQLGIKNNRVVAMYSNNSLWESKYNVNIGTNKATLASLLPQPLDGIVKGNTRYLFPAFKNDTEYEVFQLNTSYLTIFYDLHRDNVVSSIMVIDKHMEENYLRHLNTSPELKEAFEWQVFDLANALRVREGLNPFTWSNIASSAATKHSRDMAENKFFNHTNTKGETPFDRMKNEGIKYRLAGENLAAGQQNPIFAHEGWMNSLGHRKALLGDYTSLGVGIWFGDSNALFNNYFTQKFYTPY